jgi:hypothetical protein
MWWLLLKGRKKAQNAQEKGEKGALICYVPLVLIRG